MKQSVSTYLSLVSICVALLTAGAGATSYVVSPKATDETKAAVAAGRAPEHGFPELHDVTFNGPAQLHPGSNLDATVSTSENVVYVEGRVKYWNVAFVQTGPGRFHLRYRVPMLPPNALGRWDFQVIARSIDGVEVKRAFRVTYKYF